MPKQRVIAYFMHESELAAAKRVMSSTDETDSFLIGDIDSSEIPGLEANGVIVTRLQQPTVQMRPLPTVLPDEATLGFGIDQSTRISFENAIPQPLDFYYVQLRGPLLESWRNQLQKVGVELLEREDNGVYKVRLTYPQVATVKDFDFVEGVNWIEPVRSTPSTTTESVPTKPGVPPTAGLRMLAFDVRLHLAEDTEKIVQWLAARNVNIAGVSGRKIRFFALENSPIVPQLALQPEVDIIAEYVKPVLYNDAARRILRADPQIVLPLGLTLDGAGQTVGVADTGIDDTHPDFAGRVQKVARGRPNDATDPAGHGTHVSGSILGDGTASAGQYKGVAPKAKLFFQSILDSAGELGGLPLDLNDLFYEAYQAGARIHNNSWGANTPSSYTINSEEVDEFVRKYPDMLIVIAAGNAGSSMKPKKAAPGFVDWLSIGSPASCKNALTVGASRSDRIDGALSATTYGQSWPKAFPDPPIAKEKVSGDADCLAAFSSRGPCDDRRIKPDVVAPGTDIASTKSTQAPLTNFWGPVKTNPHYAFDGGTSMAAPLVSGCAALIRQYYLDGLKHQPSAALLKATLVNGTRWLKGTDSQAPSAGTPNYHQGHGRIDLQLSIPNTNQLGMNLRFVDDWRDTTRSFTRTGDRRRFQFVLPGESPELRFCMAYTDSPARALQNNLNLMVQHVESNSKWMGNEALPDALVIPDADNNLEAIKVAPAPAGSYFIQVFAGNLLKVPQDFALVVTGFGLPGLTEI